MSVLLSQAELLALLLKKRLMGYGWCCVCGQSRWEGKREQFSSSIEPVCGDHCFDWWKINVLEPIGWPF